VGGWVSAHREFRKLPTFTPPACPIAYLLPLGQLADCNLLHVPLAVKVVELDVGRKLVSLGNRGHGRDGIGPASRRSQRRRGKHRRAGHDTRRKHGRLDGRLGAIRWN